MLHEKMGMENEPDPFFLTTWDASHWFDLVMQKLREDDASFAFLRRLIKRSNKLDNMFGRGHAEYTGLAASLKLKALETITFATTRFFSSSYEQRDKVYASYKALVETYRRCRENEDEEDETKYEVIIFMFNTRKIKGFLKVF